MLIVFKCFHSSAIETKVYDGWHLYCYSCDSIANYGIEWQIPTLFELSRKCLRLCVGPLHDILRSYTQSAEPELKLLE